MDLSGFLFPRRCLGCGKQGQYFCSACLQLIKAPKKPICPQCFKPSLLGSTHARCLKPLSLDGLMVVARYEGAVREAIRKLKYKFVTDLAEELVSLIIGMIEEFQDRFFPKFDSTWVLVPVPLHPGRERWRGFNQSELLGKMIAQKLNWRFCSDVSIRCKHAKPQAELREKEERRQNILGAFRVNPNSSFLIPGSKLILFDDVWTTGSTIKECAQVLKRAKADKVWGLTLAR